MSGTAIPVGVNLTSIGVDAAWWLTAARRVEAAGYDAVWAWDHFVSRGRLDDPVLECWSTIAAAATVTSRLRVGSFVTNVMNRHPAVLARIVGTVADIAPGRVELGIGIGGHPAEHAAYGIEFPPPMERAARLEDAVAAIRALWTGGPVDLGRPSIGLRRAYAAPAPRPTPRIIIGGETPAGARLAARIGDAWTCFAERYDALLPVFLTGLEDAGRSRSDVPILVAAELPDRGAESVTGVHEPSDPGSAADVDDLGAWAAAWQARGADELVLHWVRPHQLEAVLAAGERVWA